MSSRANLQRLLDPQSIALVGGADAELAAVQCAELFKGRSYGVNPRRETLGGLKCYKSVEDLPEAPDAVFLATPRATTIETLRSLSQMGAGGVACFTAGYGELGDAGQQAERALVEACGDMALVGPNCYGLINYSSQAILWPFGAGRQQCDRGVALIMQSGMLPANLTMNDRSVPISFVVSAGNQAALAIEDYIDILVDDPRVTAIGLYIEGVKDLRRFTSAAIKALNADKPIVVLKAGSSDIASSLAVSHTGSLAGSNQAFDALFEDYGMIRVESPVTMLETLKFLSVSGAPKGNRLAAFTCSGGDAAMVADYCHKVGLDLPKPGAQQANDLESLLPDIATISNPLDYTVPIWGNTEVMPKVFSALLSGDYDVAVVIQDFPPPHIHEDNSYYRNDALSFASAVALAGIPGAVCSDLPENLDKSTRELLIARGITPLQGLDAGLDAIKLAASFGMHRLSVVDQSQLIPFVAVKPVDSTDSRIVPESEAKQRLHAIGIGVPKQQVCEIGEACAVATQIGYPVVVKAVLPNLAHKTELGAVQLNLNSDESVQQAVDQIRESIRAAGVEAELTDVLVEEMIQDADAELLVGVTTDAQFGKLLVIGSGGILVELLADTVTLLLPASPQRILQALKRLKIWQLLNGYRGRPACNIELLIDSITKIAAFACDTEELLELDINPMMVGADRVIVADVLIREAIVPSV
ncbi:MAG: acyl-CoA synthetase (NDP forming) [Parasphingorhabdus sp.]|jgi:acyl-CoA synthetase (NDP forming)